MFSEMAEQFLGLVLRDVAKSKQISSKVQYQQMNSIISLLLHQANIPAFYGDG